MEAIPALGAAAFRRPLALQASLPAAFRGLSRQRRAAPRSMAVWTVVIAINLIYSHVHMHGWRFSTADTVTVIGASLVGGVVFGWCSSYLARYSNRLPK